MGGHRWTALLLVAVLLAVPASQALNVATRSVKARPSEAYSPDTAWEEGYYGCNTTIAVFDEGVDDEHPYLAAEPASGRDTTATEPVHDAANDGNPQPIAGDHGTPVAGIAVSNAGEAFTTPDQAPDYGEDALVGVAPCAHLVDVQFSDVPNLFGEGPAGEAPVDGFTEDVVQAFEWAIENKDASWGDDDPTNDGIDVITMSWSPNDKTDGTDPICQAATEAVEAGIVVLGSAGNSGGTEEPDLGCPTGADGAISVANLYNQRTVNRSDDELRDSSTWGPRKGDGDRDPYEELKPTVAAPGHDVISTGASLADGSEYGLACFGAREVPDEVPGLATFFVPMCEEEFGGTSAATPMTAGVVALMLDANPDLSPAGVKAILHQTADPHEEMDLSAEDLSAKWDERYGYGMVDAHEAVQAAERWPGVEMGRDRDMDGVRDVVDARPADPSVANVTVSANLSSVGGLVDTDGDGVVDANDTQPLDPRSADEPIEPQAGVPDPDEPVGVPAVSGALAAALVAATAAAVGLRRP